MLISKTLTCDISVIFELTVRGTNYHKDKPTE